MGKKGDFENPKIQNHDCSSAVSFRFKEVPFFFLKSKNFDLRKILCSKFQNGNQKKISYVGEFAS